MEVRVDDEPDGPDGQLADFGEQRAARRCQPGIDEEHAIVSDLHRDVRACAEDRVDVALDVQRLERRRGAAGRRLLRTDRDGPAGQACPDRKEGGLLREDA